MSFRDRVLGGLVAYIEISANEHPARDVPYYVCMKSMAETPDDAEWIKRNHTKIVGELRKRYSTTHLIWTYRYRLYIADRAAITGRFGKIAADMLEHRQTRKQALAFIASADALANTPAANTPVANTPVAATTSCSIV